MATRVPPPPDNPEVRFHLTVEAIRADLTDTKEQIRAIRGHMDTMSRHMAAINDRLDGLETSAATNLSVYKDGQRTAEERDRVRRERTDKVLSEIWSKGGSWFMLAAFFLIASAVAKALDIPLPFQPATPPALHGP